MTYVMLTTFIFTFRFLSADRLFDTESVIIASVFSQTVFGVTEDSVEIDAANARRLYVSKKSYIIYCRS